MALQRLLLAGRPSRPGTCKLKQMARASAASPWGVDLCADVCSCLEEGLLHPLWFSAPTAHNNRLTEFAVLNRIPPFLMDELEHQASGVARGNGLCVRIPSPALACRQQMYVCRSVLDYRLLRLLSRGGNLAMQQAARLAAK